MVSANQTMTKMTMILTMMTMMMVTMVRAVGAESSCMWLRKQQGSARSESMFQMFSNRTMAALQTMGNSTSAVELTDFPYRQYSHASILTSAEKLLVLTDTLSELQLLFHSGNHSQTGWKQQQLTSFSNELYRQTDELQRCVEQLNVSPSNSVSNVSRRIKLHLKAQKRKLREQAYSASCWEEVRAALLAHLLRLDQLAAAI